MKFIAKVVRGGRVESIHSAEAFVLDDSGRVLLQSDNPELQTFMRSAVKPFQAYPLVQSGAADAFHLSAEELAVCCASHNSEDIHIEKVQEMQKRCGLSESDLRCGYHTPIDENTAEEQLRRDVQFTQLHNNCSGKHTGMLLTCKHRDYPLKGYTKPDHPLQRDISQYLEQLIGRNNIFTGVDGCSVPTFYLSVKELALLFQNLVDYEDKHLGRIFNAMTTAPYMVAGRNRFDTTIMQVGEGAIVSKVGAEGLRGVGIRQNDNTYGVAVKVKDGAKRVSAPIVLEILRRLEILNPLKFEELMPYYRPVIRNHRNIEVGHIEAELAE